MEVPELAEGQPNEFLTKLFAKVRDNLAKESASLAPQKEQYEAAMKEAELIVAEVQSPEDVPVAAKKIKGLAHALTSEKEATAMLKARLTELGIVWNKTTKAYEYKTD